MFDHYHDLRDLAQLRQSEWEQLIQDTARKREYAKDEQESQKRPFFSSKVRRLFRKKITENNNGCLPSPSITP